MSRITIVAIVICALMPGLSLGCASVDIKAQVQRPAEINMSSYKTVGIWEIEGEGGADLRDILTESVHASGRFKVVDHKDLTRILEQNKLQASGEFDERTTAQLGRLLGATAVISGRVGTHQYSENTSHESVKVVEYVDGKAVERQATRYTRTGVAKARALLKVTSLEQGKVLVPKNIEKVAQRVESATGKEPASIDGDELLKVCRQAVVADFMKAIAPWTEDVQVLLFKGDGVFEFGGEPQFIQGIECAQRGDWEMAAKAFKTAVEHFRPRKADEPQLLARACYNYAVALQYHGAFDEALKAFGEALAAESDTRFVAQQTRCRQDRTSSEKLKEQLGGS